jgi:hypothetical protein
VVAGLMIESTASVEELTVELQPLIALLRHR